MRGVRGVRGEGLRVRARAGVAHDESKQGRGAQAIGFEAATLT